MRIISEFHDYYDSVQAQGQDQTVVYIRKKKEDTVKEWPFPACRAISWSWSRAQLKCRQSIIGFCGKIYPVLELDIGSGTRPYHRPALDDATTLCWNLEDVDAFVEAHYKKKEIAGYRQTKGYNRQWNHASRRVSFQEFFDECARKQEAFIELFRENRSPIFVADYRKQWWSPKFGWKTDHKIEWNAELKEWKFYKIFDVYSAFQEIYCFMSGLAVPLKPIPDIADKVMAEAKGFNKYSFRKDPTKKR